jgi:streptogramin lyase
VDVEGNLYIGGRNANDGAFVRIVHRNTGTIETLARGGFPAGAVGVKTANANLSDPTGIVATLGGKILVSATQSQVIVELGSATSLIAGVPRQKGYSGDGSPAAQATFASPGALAIDGNGNLFVADYFNHRIRRIDAITGVVTTVAGDGNATSSGDGGPAIAAGVRYPYALAVNSAGDIFVVENGAFKVRRVDSVSGTIETVAGTGRAGYSGDGGLAPRADINPTGIAVDQRGNLYISDREHNRIRRVDVQGIISTVAGNGLPHRKIEIE